MGGRERTDLLIAVSLGLFALLCVETGLRLRGAAAITGPYVAAGITTAPVQIGVLAAAIRYRGTDLFADHGPRIVRWSVLGMLGMGVAVGLFAPFLYENAYRRVATVRWGVTVGLGAGFYAGYHNARITAQRIAAERAAVRAEEAGERRELLEYLNALLRHEVLNAVNVIGGRAELLRRTVSDPEATEHLDVIRRQSEEMTGVIDDVRTLLNVSRGTVDRPPIDLTEVVRRSVAKVQRRHDEVEVDVTLPDTAVVAADDLLPRVFDNLLRNSVEHAETSPVRIEVTGRRADGAVVVAIADNGPGIPSPLRGELFAPSVERSDDKTRLGTVIVGRLVEQHNGDVRVVETGPDGTVIEVRLPLAPTSRSESESEPKPA